MSCGHAQVSQAKCYFCGDKRILTLNYPLADRCVVPACGVCVTRQDEFKKITQERGLYDPLQLSISQKPTISSGEIGDGRHHPVAQMTKPPQWLKADELKGINGDIKFKILTEAKSSEGNYGEETICEVNVIVKNEKERGKWRINDKSKINLINAYGPDSADWIGKEFDIEIDQSSTKPSIIARPKKE